jgi:hypothetical protein
MISAGVILNADIVTIMSLTKEQKQNEFELIWRLYPNKDSKKKSCQIYHKIVKTYSDIENVRRALNNYLELLKLEKWRKCKSGSTFFNNYEDWIEYKQVETQQQVINNSMPVEPLTQDRINQIKYSFSLECQQKIRQKLRAAWLMRPIRQ